jgi:hypothetical protein
MSDPTMTEREAQLRAEAIALAATLHDVIEDTCDAEAIRIALSGLQNTAVGRAYLTANPFMR